MKRLAIALPALLLTFNAWGHSDTIPVYFLEFHQPTLGKYMMVTVPEADAIEQGAHKGWSRAGPLMAVHAHPESGFPPVCRIDGKNSNAVYFSIDAQECNALRRHEEQLRTDQNYEGPSYIGTAFYALPATEGACPANSKPVFHSDNGKPKDISHRYLTDPLTYQAMAGKGWKNRGIVFCLPAEPPADAPKPGALPESRPEVDAAKIKAALRRFYGEDTPATNVKTD